jgi:hypothetical protein
MPPGRPRGQTSRMYAPPQRRSRRGTYLPLLIIGGGFLVIAAALMVFAVIMQQQDMADGQADGNAEAAGFVFMTGLIPGVLGMALLIPGIVVFAREPVRPR